MQEYIFINGQFVKSQEAKIHVTDLALLRGYGIFDFFRAINGKPIFMEDHLDRFENSARLMGLTIPANRVALRNIIQETIRLNPYPTLGIKMILTGGYSPDGYVPAEAPNLIVIGKPFTFKEPKQGLKLLSFAYQREIPEIKTLNYIVPIRLLPQLKAAQADDVLYYANNLISESSRSNIFIVKNQTIVTPQTGVLYGITRKHVLKVAAKHYAVEERDISLAEYWEADEVFTTGSTKRLLPIVQTDDVIFNKGKIGTITQHLQEAFLAYEKGVG